MRLMAPLDAEYDADTRTLSISGLDIETGDPAAVALEVTEFNAFAASLHTAFQRGEARKNGDDVAVFVNSFAIEIDEGPLTSVIRFIVQVKGDDPLQFAIRSSRTGPELDSFKLAMSTGLLSLLPPPANAKN